MIVIDATEAKKNSRLPEINGAVVSDVLESVTGGDIMITTRCFPVTNEALIRRHIEHNAILIQRKSLADLVSSILDEGVNISIARMIACGTKHQWQRVIMSTGFYIPDTADGKTLVGELLSYKNRKVRIRWSLAEPGVDFGALRTITIRMLMRGAVHLPLVCDAEIPGVLKKIESDLAFLASRQNKELLHLPQFPPDPPDPSDPLQVPIEVKDARVVIAAFRGVGPKRTNDLWNALREENERLRPLEDGWDEKDWEPTLCQALVWITTWKREWVSPKKIPGWGKGTIASVRDQMGFLDGQDLYYRNTEVLDKEN